MVRAAISEPWSIKATRRKRGDMEELREGLYKLLSDRHPQTVRQLFYAMVSAGLIDKTEHDYKNVVVRLCGDMREADELPWEWITDGTRWMRKPRSYSSLEEAVCRTAETYRRALWDDQEVYVEIWCEKEALAGVLYEITAEYDVPLMIVKGFPSKDFVHGAAEVIEAEDKPAYVYYFGDWDPSGVKIGEDVEAKLNRYAPEADITFRRVAVTPDQVREYQLLTRPTKRDGNSHAKNFRGNSVELDALPVEILHDMVRGLIEQHIDPHQLQITKLAEKSEREALRLARTFWKARSDKRGIPVGTGVRERSPALVDEDEAAFYLTVSPDALRSWRRAGTGPRHVRLGTRVKYRIADLDQWISKNSYPKAPGSHAVEEADLEITDEDVAFIDRQKP